MLNSDATMLLAGACGRRVQPAAAWRAEYVQKGVHN